MQYQTLTEFLTYDQISLVPVHVSSLFHRAEADTSVQFGPVKLGVPIIAAPMPDVSNGTMAYVLDGLQSLGFIHRFQSLEKQKEEMLLLGHEMFHYPAWHPRVGIAISLTDYDEVVKWFYPSLKIFCLDTANGASEMVREAVGRLKDAYPDIFIITGNVATAEAFYQVQEWGVDAIRVGIAGGSVCETRTETGIYSPMATSVYACNLAKRKALLIADGGIRTPADMCKALALGADVVMMGGALAGTQEAPGPVIQVDGKKYKRLAGAASYVTQKESKGSEPEYIEGSETLVPYRGSVEKVISRFAAGLRSSMSYADARTLEEYRSNIKIIRVFNE